VTDETPAFESATDTPPTRNDGNDIHAKVRFLSSAAAYGSTTHVEAIETHMSWVFLTTQSAYKLKKPVKYAFLDFSTPAARAFDCREEVRLNARLAPGIYEDVVPLSYCDGAFRLGAYGKVVDWLVKMRRLPATEMMDSLILDNRITHRDVEKVAAILSRFYRHAEPVEIRDSDYIAHFSAEHSENCKILPMPRYGLPAETVQKLLAKVGDTIADKRHLLTDRIRAGAIVEGHGDLRPEHICMTDPPVIFDCLEFNRVFRLIDPFDELAFLALECERLGAGWIGPVLFRQVDGIHGETPDGELIDFYTSFRALLRARLALAHLLDPHPRTPERWVPLAREYIDIAAKALLKPAIPATR